MTERNYTAGASGGLAGGIVLGIILSTLGLIPYFANLVGSDSAIVGWIVHLILSILVGLVYAWWWGASTISYGRGSEWGLLHGVIWWVIGSLLFFPLMLGLGVQLGNAFNGTNLVFLIGNLIYGLMLGLVYYAMIESDIRQQART